MLNIWMRHQNKPDASVIIYVIYFNLGFSFFVTLAHSLRFLKNHRGN